MSNEIIDMMRERLNELEREYSESVVWIMFGIESTGSIALMVLVAEVFHSVVWMIAGDFSSKQIVGQSTQIDLTFKQHCSCRVIIKDAPKILGEENKVKSRTG